MGFGGGIERFDAIRRPCQPRRFDAGRAAPRRPRGARRGEAGRRQGRAHVAVAHAGHDLSRSRPQAARSRMAIDFDAIDPTRTAIRSQPRRWRRERMQPDAHSASAASPRRTAPISTRTEAEPVGWTRRCRAWPTLRVDDYTATVPGQGGLRPARPLLMTVAPVPRRGRAARRGHFLLPCTFAAVRGGSAAHPRSVHAPCWQPRRPAVGGLAGVKRRHPRRCRGIARSSRTTGPVNLSLSRAGTQHGPDDRVCDQHPLYRTRHTDWPIGAPGWRASRRSKGHGLLDGPSNW